MDWLTSRPILIVFVLSLLCLWWTDRERFSLNVIASVFLGITGLLFFVFVFPPVGVFLLLSLSAGCLLGLSLSLYRRYTRA